MWLVNFTLIVFVLGCSQEEQKPAEPEVDPTVALQEAYTEFQSTNGEAAKSYFNVLKSIERKARIDYKKDPILSSDKITITYDFKNTGNGYVHIEDTTFLSMVTDMTFKGNYDLGLFSDAVHKPLDQFLPKRCKPNKYNDPNTDKLRVDKCRLRELKTLNRRFLPRIEKQKYVIVVRHIVLKKPQRYSDGYNAGNFVGHILVYDIAAQNLLASYQAKTTSSESVSASRSENLNLALSKDFERHMQTAIHKSISDNAEVVGKLPEFIRPEYEHYSPNKL
jgi:hypothetical protein